MLISHDTQDKGIIVFKENKTELIKIDVIFPVLHGKNGEDGKLQGLMHLSGIPFVGCDTLSSAVCMDKAVTHTLLSAANIEQAKYLWFFSYRYKEAADKINQKIAARLDFPVFVKPANAGSSVGVSKVEKADDLEKAILKAAKEDKKIIVEEGIKGREVECAVIGNEGGAEASGVGEIEASAEFYDYDDKYINGTSKVVIPADIDDEVTEKIRKEAVRAYRHLGCAGLARVDFFVKDDNTVVLNEVNTMPGFTDISMYTKLWNAMGMTYGEVIDKLIDLAVPKD